VPALGGVCAWTANGTVRGAAASMAQICDARRFRRGAARREDVVMVMVFGLVVCAPV